MTGKNFCEATEDAYYLIIRNAWRFGTVHGLGGIYTFVGELAMTSLATFYGYLLITQHPDIEGKIYSPTMMCVVRISIENMKTNFVVLCIDIIYNCSCLYGSLWSIS